MGLLAFLKSLLPERFTPDALEALRARDARTVLLDVREPHEFAEGHIAGSVLVPMGKVPHHAAAIAEAGLPVVVICRSGARAGSCDAVLRQAGAREVHTLSGGVIAWQRAGRTLVKGSKSPALAQALKKK